MNKYIQNFLSGLILLCIISFSAVSISKAANGDTTKVRTIDFLAPRTGWFTFPADPSKFEKIYLNYKLRCPPGKPCGEWDYLAHVFIRTYYAPSFRVDSAVVKTFEYSENPTYNYSFKFDGGNLTLDSTVKKSTLLEFYSDPVNLTTRTDSKMVYKPSYRYFVNSGNLDSALVGNDNKLTLTSTKVDYNDKVTYAESVELFRYITPYGNGLDLGSGFTWTQEVTDFASMLNGKVFLDAPNGQEDLELTFDFVDGTPAREVKRLIPLWQKWVTYNGNFEKQIDGIEISLNENETNAKYKHIQTGHGFGGNSDNCAEFCRKEGYLKINGEQKYKTFVWRECGDNPVFPQGGTWLIDRTNWCPGAEVAPYDVDITDYITNKTFTVDWDMEFYNTPYNNGSNQDPRWLINSYVITYGDKKFTNNAEMYDIIRPSKKQIYQRLNPVCNQPTVVFRNSGSANLTSLVIEYGDKLGSKSTYNWTGNLKFGDTTWVVLPPFEMGTNPNNEFVVELKNPNGQTDEYPVNNLGYSNYSYVPEYYNNLTFELTTNNYDILGSNTAPYRYQIKNQNGDVVFNLNANENRKKYSNDLLLEDGCYELTLENQLGYGLYFWILARNNDGSNNGFYAGNFKILNNNVTSVLNFNSDFGNTFIHHFTVSVQPTIAVSENLMKFGTVKVGEEFTRKVVIKPENKRGLKITKIEVLLSSFKGFSIQKTIPEIPTNGLNMEEGDSLEVYITFKPKSNGDKATSLLVYSNDKVNTTKKIDISAFGGEVTSVENDIVNNQLPEIQITNNNNENLELSYLSNNTNSINLSISIVDLLGNSSISSNFVITNNLSNSNLIDISNLKTGVYFVVINDGMNIITDKVIINR